MVLAGEGGQRLRTCWPRCREQVQEVTNDMIQKLHQHVCSDDQFFYSPPGEQENIAKFSKRLVKVTRQHNDECKKLLTLMGVPYIKVCLKFCSFP